jgi:hypothetical protein
LGPWTNVIYGFKHIFAGKFCENIGGFAETTASFNKTLITAMAFDKNDNFFRRKIAKIAENCDHNIGPRSDLLFLLVRRNPSARCRRKRASVAGQTSASARIQCSGTDLMKIHFGPKLFRQFFVQISIEKQP